MKLLSPVLLFLALAAPAQADITESRVTSPAGPTYRLYETERMRAKPMLEVEAMTDAANQEESVDIICSWGNEHDVVLKNQPVDADGSLETAVPLDNFPPALCDLRVVPAGYDGPDFSSYT